MSVSIAIYTSTRADFGLLKPLITKLSSNKSIEVRLFVTGTHLNENFGNTVQEIEAEFSNLIYYRLPQDLSEDFSIKLAKPTAEALSDYAKVLSQDKPDYAVVLGDRFEAFSFALACTLLKIPLFHLHGGEVTTGALDDKFRHCISKLADWHFTASEEYRKRVIQLGENPNNVFNSGALGVDNALNLKLRDKAELAKILKMNIPEQLFTFTFHPETNSSDYGVTICNELLSKFYDYVNVHENALLLITGVNTDEGSAQIKKVIESYLSKGSSKIVYYESLGYLNYLSIVKISTCVLGNSSSGILETYSLRTPTLNVGTRQDGRTREISVIDCADVRSLKDLKISDLISIKENLKDEKRPSQFGNGTSSQVIADNIIEIVTSKSKKTPVIKRFFDLKA